MLDTIALGNTGRSTTRLGFGCSSIMGALGQRDSLRMLEAAFDAGIRHFDVAPMYGYGEAEVCLGEFLRRHPGQCTVTTKFGILPKAQGALASIARSTLRPILSRFPGLKQAVAARRGVLAPKSLGVLPQPAKVPNPIFNAVQAKFSLHHSLAVLKVERIDVLLLHDVAPADLANDDLLHFLQQSVESGLVGTFGVGTDRSEIEPLLSKHPAYCPVTQYEWSVFNPVPPASDAFRIHHRSLTNNFRALHADLAADRDRCQRWSQSTGADLADPAVLARLMLKAALLLNPESIILFSSKSPKHIHANVADATETSLAAPALELYRAIHAEPIS